VQQHKNNTFRMRETPKTQTQQRKTAKHHKQAQPTSHRNIKKQKSFSQKIHHNKQHFE